MKIEQLAAVFPSRVVTNDDVLNMIREESRTFSGDLDKTLKHVRRALKASGSVTRRWLGKGESSLGLTVQACKQAMQGLERSDQIDLLIVASVYSELVEPASSNLIAHEIGLDHVECFDMKEACDGWMKAVKIASALIGAGQYKRVMVVNAEFSMTPGFAVYPGLYNLPSADALEHRFPAFTLGEAATAVILRASPENPWQFTNHTRNDLYDLCSVTSSWNGADLAKSDRLAKNGPGMFTSYGAKLVGHGLPLAVDQFKNAEIRPEDVDILFTHSSSKKDWSEASELIGLGDRVYDLYARYGNVVSAAVPAAMALAAEEGTLKRGQRVVALVASAGMSFSTAAFAY